MLMSGGIIGPDRLDVDLCAALTDPAEGDGSAGPPPKAALEAESL